MAMLCYLCSLARQVADARAVSPVSSTWSKACVRLSVSGSGPERAPGSHARDRCDRFLALSVSVCLSPRRCQDAGCRFLRDVRLVVEEGCKQMLMYEGCKQKLMSRVHLPCSSHMIERGGCRHGQAAQLTIARRQNHRASC